MFVVAVFVNGKFEGLCQLRRPIAYPDQQDAEQLAKEWRRMYPPNSDVEYRVGRVIFDEVK